MDMIEKVARAICSSVDRDPDLNAVQTPFGDQTPMPRGWKQWQNYKHEARAAIAAMRAPTKAMLEASNREWDGRMSHRSSSAWQAMIDAALANGQQPK